ncbi:MAG: S8 family peptidase [Bacteroidia bacterium]|nr:S8 family peptidase [Bacteroidia bacterium]
MRLLKPLFITALFVALLTNCGSAPIISTPIENIDNTPLKESELTENEQKTWGHLDLVNDTIPGMSVDKAYNELLEGRKGKTVIVAVIDSGIDIEHEDLDGVIWTNLKEKPNNGKDDDKNGYVDDIHGWNFLGDAYNEQLEMTRILAENDSSNPDFMRAKEDYEKEYGQTLQVKQNIEGLMQQIPPAQELIRKHLGKEDYVKEDVIKIQTEDQGLLQAKNIQLFLYQQDLTYEKVKEAAEQYTEILNYHLSKDFKGRKTNDNINDLTDIGYGNNNVLPVKKSESHGTHVAGIIAAERNNGKGMKGVADNVKIMTLRVVPNGDEYDKDVALSIRYAVDNGAKVINGSFGKDFSPHSKWVRDAIAYAGEKDVVFVHAAGNDSKNIDKEPNYPNDNINNGPEVSNSYITVGALAPKYGSDMVARFSNYGKNNVDVFAPGARIFSTTPENEYDTKGGTSMAAPAVAGIAALIRSYYPKLSAAQVKEVILNSGLPIKSKVVVAGKPEDVRTFNEICKSGKIANAYNALVMASQMSR